MGTTRAEQNKNILQEYGNIESIFDTLEDNNMFHFTDDLLSGYKDLKGGKEAFKKDIVEYYSSRKLKPTTSITDDEDLLLANFSDVDYMIIEDDFIID